MNRADLVHKVLREAERADRRRWASARTLADLGELTALWLEGKIGSVPSYYGGPDEETLPHVPVLAAVNRAGFLTVNMQSADGPWEAWVNGFASDEALARLRVACGRPLLMSGRRGREHFGDSRSRWAARAIRSEYPCGGCLASAWFVEIADPEPGRNDRLWPALERFAARR